MDRRNDSPQRQGREAAVWTRPLIPATLALMAGVAGPAWGLSLSQGVLHCSLIVLGLALALTWWLRLNARVLPLLVLALLGLALSRQAQAPAFPPHHVTHLGADREVTLLARLDKPGRLGQERVQLFAMAEALRTPAGWQPATGRVMVSAPRLEPPPVGTRLVVKGRLREVQGLKNPGAFNQARHWAAEGVFRQVTVRQTDDIVFLAGTEGYPLAERLRGGVRRLLKDRDDITRSLYLAMLLGDQGEITQAQRQALSRTGTSHLLVVNGLHLSMVAGAVYFLASWLLRRSAWLLLRVNVFRVCTVLAAAAVAAYAWVAGGSPSTQRAEVMVLSYLFLVFLGRARDIWSAAALAALVILVLSPLRLFSISFQLSFAAVLAIVVLVPRWAGESPGETGTRGQGARPRAQAWFRLKEWICASAAASLATAPLVAYHFQVVSVLGWLVNVAAIPLVLVLALPLGEAAVFCQALHLSSAAEFFLWLGSWPLRAGYWTVAQTAVLPLAAMSVPTPGWLQVALCYALPAFLFGCAKPSRRWGGVVCSALLLAGTVVWPRLAPADHLEITVLDSRTGLDGVVVTPAGQRLAFTAGWEGWSGAGGGGFPALPSYLHWRQFRRVDAVIGLGVNRRNAPGLLTLAQQFRVGGLWFRELGDKSPEVVELINYLGDQGTPARPLEKAQPPGAWGKLELACPPLADDRGVCLVLTWEGRRVCLAPPRRVTGAAALNLPPGPPLAVLVAPGDWPETVVAGLRPQVWVAYGSRAAAAGPAGVKRYNSGDGAVSLTVTAAGVEAAVWRRP